MTAPARSAAALAACLLLVAGCARDDVEAIRGTLDAYRAALAARNGEAAAALVDRTTLAYYDRVRRLALGAEAARLRGAPPGLLLQVLTLRLDAGDRALTGADGRAVLALLVAGGRTGRVQDAPLEEVVVEGDRARGLQHLPGGVALPWQFVREGGRWRVSLSAQLERAEAMLARLVARSSLDNEQFVLKVLQRRLGHPVPQRVWRPRAAGAMP